MTAHLHRQFVKGCYRCELGKDEAQAMKAEAQQEIGWCDQHGCMAQRYDDGSISCYHQALTSLWTDTSCSWEPLGTAVEDVDLNGWKVFVSASPGGDEVVLEAVTDERIVTRLTFHFTPDESDEIAESFHTAAAVARGGHR